MFGSENHYDSLDTCVSSAVNQCSRMSNAELERILQSDAEIDALIQNLPQVRSLPSEREVGLTENKTLAEWNLGQESILNDLKEKVKVNYERASKLKAEVEALKSSVDSDSSGKSLDTTHNLLLVAAHEADDDAEAITQEFYNGNTTTELFLKSFMDKKKVAHLRKIKAERLLSLLRDQQYAPPPTTRTAHAAPYPEIANHPRHPYF